MSDFKSSRQILSEQSPNVPSSSSNSIQPSKGKGISRRQEAKTDGFSQYFRWTSPPSAVDSSVSPISKKRKFTPPLLSSSQSGSSSTPSAPTQVSTDDNHTHLPESSDPPLTPQQSSILNKIMGGENVFFTGAAGTGKSLLVRAIVRSFNGGESAEPYGKLAVTAPTGMAALNIGGVTIHSWAGVGLGIAEYEVLLQGVLGNPYAKKRWRSAKALLIDEVSMLDGKLFDSLEHIARDVRKDPRPIGGLQIILSGDFFQLAPIDGDDPDTGLHREAIYAFDAKSWPAIIPKVNIYILSQVFRQRDDHFVRILNDLRRGWIDEEAKEVLLGLGRGLGEENGIEPVYLYPIRRKAAAKNAEKLREILLPMRTFIAEDIPGVTAGGVPLSDKQATDRLNRTLKCSHELGVKIGATVMLVQNIVGRGLANGSIGKVVDFLTIAEAESAGIFVLSNEAPNRPDRSWPLVEFPDSQVNPRKPWQPRTLLLPRIQFVIKNANDIALASRIQVPLMLAWYGYDNTQGYICPSEKRHDLLSVCAAQGQTLERVCVDLKEDFADGMAYVALSRARSLEGLELRGFGEHGIHTSARVIEWSDAMERAHRDRTKGE